FDQRLDRRVFGGLCSVGRLGDYYVRPGIRPIRKSAPHDFVVRRRVAGAPRNATTSSEIFRCEAARSVFQKTTAKAPAHRSPPLARGVALHPSWSPLPLRSSLLAPRSSFLSPLS